MAVTVAQFLSLAFVCALTPLALGEVYFKETFDDDWADRWVQSSNKQESGEAGSLLLSAGEFYGDAEADRGLQTSEDAKFYSYSSKIETPFAIDDKDLILQFSVKHEQNIDCGGGYIKLMGGDTNQESFDGDSQYNIMFGPDICGSSTKRVHVIFRHGDENYLIKDTIRCETDRLTHVYTLILHPDSTYEVRIDGEKKKDGSLYDDWEFELPKEIDDPEASKPDDWVNDAMIDDPEDVKPDDWDKETEQIEDPDAEMPDDWDQEFDGDWEAPMLPNPKYKGAFRAKRIENPDYVGVWEHPQAPNPDYVHVENVGKYPSNAYVAFELWQVKSGTIFDNIIVTDSIEEAEAFMEETFGKSKDAEKEMFDKAEEDKREKDKIEREAREAEREAAKEAEKEDEADTEVDDDGDDDDADANADDASDADADDASDDDVPDEEEPAVDEDDEDADDDAASPDDDEPVAHEEL